MMARRPYLTTTRLDQLREQLGPREYAILETLQRVRVASARQLQRLHFPDGEPQARARRRRHSLARLVSLRVLARLHRRIGGIHAGSAGFVYALDLAGLRLLVDGDHEAGRVQPPWTPSAPFLAHALAVTELYVELVEAERQGMTELVRFEAEPDCWRPFIGAHGGRVALKPDAFVITATGEWEDRWFVEMDCSTESPAVITGKAQSYLAYWRSGREQATGGVFPLVVFVVPDEPRRSVIAQVAGRLPEAEQALFRAVLTADACRVLAGGTP